MIKLSKEERRLFIDTLLSIKNGNVLCKTVGICGNLSLLMPSEHKDVCYALVYNLSKSWPETTGNGHFPIRSEYNGKWEGSQLESRKRLINHLVFCLKYKEVL
tara:strand:- start:372 stop:680 length:309 start_codon:yes stop_codon:yes gene_type:complete